jgi:hypothetical protein
MPPIVRLRRGLLPLRGGPPGSRRLHNPVPTLVRLAMLAFLLGLAAMSLFLFSPASVGLLREEYVTPEAYAFKRLQVKGAYFSLDVKDGVIIPASRGRQVSGAVILGTGLFVLDLPSPAADQVAAEIGMATPTDTCQVLYLPADYEKVETLKDQAGAEKVDPSPYLDRVRRVIAQNKAAEGTVTLMGVARQFRTVQEAVVFYGDKLGTVRLTEGSLCAVTLGGSGQEKAFTFINPAARSGQFFPARVLPGLLLGSLAIFGAMALLLLFLVFILTVDVHVPLPPDPGALLDSPWSLWGLIAIDVILMTILEFVHAGRAARAAPGLLVFAAALALLVRANRNRRDAWTPARGFLGLTGVNLRRALFVGLSLGALSVTAGTVSFPAGIQMRPWPEVAGAAAWAFGAIGLGRTGFYHGYVQTYLASRLGPREGWLLTAAICGLVYLIPKAMGGHGPSVAMGAESLFVIPITTALNGYLFMRTRSLWGVILSRGLLDFLPAVLKF